MILENKSQEELIAKAVQQESDLRTKQDFRSLTILANHYHSLGLEEKACKLLLEIASFGGPASFDAHKELSKIFYSRADIRRAAYHNTQVIVQSPESSITLENFKYLAKDPQINTYCREMLETVVNKKEANWRQLIAYAFLLRMKGDFDLAANYVARATDVRHPTTSLLKTNRIEPSFIVAGAMKSGTTALFNMIASHKRVLPPLLKEIEYDFFSNEQVPKEWYLSHFQRERVDSNFIAGEANPGIYAQPFAKRMKETFPKIKLIFILRNPVDRAISHYYHVKNSGFEMRSIDEALLKDIDVLEPFTQEETCLEEKVKTFIQRCNHPETNHYLSFGLYDLLLTYWRSYFSDEQIFVASFDDLINDREKLLNQVYDFLNLEKANSIEEVYKNKGSYTRKNEGEVEIKLRKFYQRTSSFMQQHYNFSW